MKLPHPFVQLPLTFDAPRLAAEIAALGEAPWRPHPQNFKGNSMLPLVAVNGDPADETFSGIMRPTPALEACPYLRQTIAALGVTVGRSRLMRLAGQSEVSLHADQGYYWVDRVRVHVPIVTQPTVRFQCGGAEVNMAEGECWIFDTWRMHRVVNANDDQRIHLVVDTVGGGEFWDLVEDGRAFPDGEDEPDWAPRHVAFNASANAAPAYENVNVPKIMTPWEATTRLAFIIGEGAGHPRLAEVHVPADRFLREWRALWARYGESDAGKADYARCLQTLIDDVQEPAANIRYGNDVLMFNVIMALVGLVAIENMPAKPRANAAQALRAGATIS